MKNVLFLVLIFLFLAQAWDEVWIKEDGKTVQKRIVTLGRAHGQGGNTLVVPSGDGNFMADYDGKLPDPHMYYLPNLLGGSIAFWTDLSRCGCACCCAFTLVAMPGKDAAGNYFPTGGNTYYCDGSKIGGNFCPEIDLFEAHKWAFYTSFHGCGTSWKGHYYSCDWGCGINTWEASKYEYGPGRLIDSTKPFYSIFDFIKSDSGALETVKITLKSGNTWWSMSRHWWECKSHWTFADLSITLRNGMGVATSNWGSQNSHLWLDEHSGCDGYCTMSPTLYFWDIDVKTGPKPPDAGKAASCSEGGCKLDKNGRYRDLEECFGECTGVYVAGDSCKDNKSGYCGGLCSTDKCKWSWPFSDPRKWDSPTANCRCFP